MPVELAEALANRGITEPFPVQEATLADTLAGHDLCGRAPTGSGKTLAFGIPMVARVTKAQPKKPTGLVLVPTRELAVQVQDAIVPMAMAKRLFVLAVYGGASINLQIKSLHRGAAIVVATPGRLQDLVDQRAIDLSNVQVCVVDEADRMADMGFLPQVRKLLDLTPPSRQTMLWSATLDGDVDTLIRTYQRNPKRHEVVVEPERLEDVNHRFLLVDKIAKVGAAATLVRRHGTGIVFVRTKHGADRVARQLETAGVKAVPLHGDRSQAQRERALQLFRRGDVHALVATDVVARGIHVDDVGVVVHWDPADDHKDYVHRSGRTGRAGAGGEVVSLVTDETRKKTTALQRLLQLPVGVERISEVPGAPVDVRVHATPASPEPAPSPAPTAEAAETHASDSNDRRPAAEPARRPRPARTDRPVRTERPARAGRFDRADRPVRAERSDRYERSERPASGDRYERTERPARPGRPARGDRFERSDRPARAEHPERSDRYGRTERPASGDRYERSERPARAERSERSERAERADGPRDRPTAGRPTRSKPAWAKADRNEWSPSPKPKAKAKAGKPTSKLKAKPGAKAAQGTAKRSTSAHGKPVAAKRTARATTSTAGAATTAATTGGKPKRLRKKPASTGVAR